jgi:hypothetical protein
MQRADPARGVNSPFHIALHSSKYLRFTTITRDLKLARHSASFLQLSKNFNPVNNFRLDCLPSRGSALRFSVPKLKTLWRNKKPGNKRRANPSCLRVALIGGH